MTNGPDGNNDKEKNKNNDKMTGKDIRYKTKLYTAFGGYFFLTVSTSAFITVIYQHLIHGGSFISGKSEIPKNIWEWMAIFSSHLIVLLAGILTASIGYGLLRTAGAALREVIPEKDTDLLYELLKENKKTALDNYVKLASLSGIVGTCTKLGITGLPLATIALTGLFAILGLIPGTESANFFDLAKLTLGAFIGSFVQKAKSEDFSQDSKSKDSSDE